MKKAGSRKRHNAAQLCAASVSNERFDAIWQGLPEGIKRNATSRDLAELVAHIESLAKPRAKMLTLMDHHIARATQAMQRAKRTAASFFHVANWRPAFPGMVLAASLRVLRARR